MSRDMTAALATALEGSTVRPVVFAFFDFPGGAVRFWAGSGDRVMSGYDDTDLNGTYTGIGDLVSVDFPEESSDGSSGGASFGLSGIPSTTTSLALTENYHNRACKVWIGALATNGSVVADPYRQFSGLMDVMTMEDDGDTASVKVLAEGYTYGVGASKDRYTDEDQQRRFPGDLGLQFVAGLQDKNIVWGMQGPQDRSGYGDQEPVGGDNGESGYTDEI
jgi:hypothetical protein